MLETRVLSLLSPVRDERRRDCMGALRISFVPIGTRIGHHVHPALKRWAIYKAMRLRSPGMRIARIGYS